MSMQIVKSRRAMKLASHLRSLSRHALGDQVRGHYGAGVAVTGRGGFFVMVCDRGDAAGT